ncbi:hypothetical protein FAGKG844_870002 [Frankia sp. AgKG'84/4]
MDAWPEQEAPLAIPPLTRADLEARIAHAETANHPVHNRDARALLVGHRPPQGTWMLPRDRE